jgi:ABC-type Fe3+/spermidine/putrescine transport system ATPase subunit
MSFGADVSATFTADGADTFAVDAAFEVEDGETLVVLGPSGSGKTLLLETVAGFHEHEGSVTLDGRRIEDVAPEKRDFGFVFQDYALFPHMTVSENVAFGDRYRDDTRDAEALLAELGVSDLADRYPPTLSGGEQQRVALARALAVRPSVLLLDEPLSSLDVPTRQSLRDDLQDLLAEKTAVHVTHNRTTARALADRIVVMNDGQVVQTGTPEEIFDRPASPLVARFTGSNVLPIDAVPALRDRLLDSTVEATHLAIRPESIRLLRGAGTDPDATGTVERVSREDATSRVVCSLVTGDGGDGSVTLDVYSTDPPAVGESVGLEVPREAISLC